MESKLKDTKEDLKKCHRKQCIRIFKHMESLNGDFSEYISNADVENIEYIVSCCELFKRQKYKCTDNERKSDLMFLNPTKKGLKK